MSRQSRRKKEKSKPGANLKHRPRNKILLIFVGLALFALACIFFYANSIQKHSSKKTVSFGLPAVHKPTPEEQALCWKTEFGQFPPYTDAERELEKMLHGKDEAIDLALANWLIIADIPEFHEFTREAYFAQLDAMTERVRQAMTRMQADGWPNADSNNPETRCQRFCSAIIGLHFDYAEKFREENLTSQQMFALYANPNNVFLAGLMCTGQGSCVSMPEIYLVIGQRLGMPIHLVTLGEHSFIRWDEPTFWVDIETTSVSKIAWTRDESVYLDTEGMTRDQLKGEDLKNLSNREVVAELFHIRSAYWHTKMGKCETQSCLDLAHADFLGPNIPNIAAAHDAIFNRYGIRPEYKSIEIRIGPTNSSANSSTARNANN